MTEQCQHTGRRGDDTFRCGRPEGHGGGHGEWQFIEPSEVKSNDNTRRIS